jgi:hypothetical protein
MCGRFTLRTPLKQVADAFDLAPTLLADGVEWPTRYNIAPTQDVAVVRQRGDEGRQLSWLQRRLPRSPPIVMRSAAAAAWLWPTDSTNGSNRLGPSSRITFNWSMSGRSRSPDCGTVHDDGQRIAPIFARADACHFGSRRLHTLARSPATGPRPARSLADGVSGRSYGDACDQHSGEQRPPRFAAMFGPRRGSQDARDFV